jgi:hypothetical protein
LMKSILLPHQGRPHSHPHLYGFSNTQPASVSST